MTLEQVQELVKAGFSHDEIMSFTSKQEETKPEETKPEETKPEETKPEETKPEEVKTVSLTDTTVEKFTTAVNNLIKTMQASNLQSAFNESTNESSEDTAIEALSTIITKPKGDN